MKGRKELGLIVYSSKEVHREIKENTEGKGEKPHSPTR